MIIATVISAEEFIDEESGRALDLSFLTGDSSLGIP